MKTMVKNIVALCLISTFMHCHLVAVAQAQEGLHLPYEPPLLFDGRLRITGQWDHIAKLRIHTPKDERWSRESALNTFRSTLSLETVYKMVRGQDLEMNVIGHYMFSYEFMDMLDDEYDKAMPTYTKSKFRHTKDEDMIRELYLQYVKGPWDIRIGKQQVVWGEQLGIQTLDVVCPLDIQTEVIGLTEWENIRIGLWMLRGMYDFTEIFPGELILEGIVIPFDYQPTQIPREGSFFGPVFHPDGIPRNGYLDRLISYRYYKDAHSLHGLNNLEWGIRLRGYLSDYDLDWTVIFFHTVDDGAVWADGGRGGDRSAAFFTAYNIARSTNDPPKDKIFDFKPYNILGFSLQRYFYSIDSIVRLEAAYVFQKHYNKQRNDRINMQGNPTRTVVEKDSISYGLQFTHKIPFPRWPAFLYDWSRGKYIDFDIALNQLYWIDYNQDFGDGDSMNSTGFRVNGQPHGRGDNPMTSISYFIMFNLMDARTTVVIRGTNYINSPSSQLGISIGYRPGEHWGYSIGTSQYWSKRRTDPYSGSEQRDDITFKIYYMF